MSCDTGRAHGEMAGSSSCIDLWSSTLVEKKNAKWKRNDVLDQGDAFHHVNSRLLVSRCKAFVRHAQ